ncbi:MAG: ParB N-terminal domain-containing protein [Bifidobacterium psychraerophilum]|uniref:ParB N-terminal domain-containing protein n=1 Tax=Bifidobacterium psychraerophilum TaxID=218140 RepID=UPI0039E966EA
MKTIDEQYNRVKENADTSTPVLVAVARAIELLVLLGWPDDVAQSGVEQICDALMRTGARPSAFESLREDKHVRVLLDIPVSSWMVLLRAMLGQPGPMYAATAAGRGVLMRLLIGETVELLLADDDLVIALSAAVPGARGERAMSDNKGTIGLEWAVPAIRVGKRHRQDRADLNPLVASIKRVGLLQPITIAPDGFLICGARRLAAIKLLGWKTVRVWIRSDLSDRLGQLLVEQDENALHKPFTPMEGAALYHELKDLLAGGAKKCSELTQFHTGHAPGEHGGGNLPTLPGTAGSTRAQAAAMVPGGVSYATFDKIGYLETVTADTAMPDELRARA